MSLKFQDKVVFITGASSGIGEAVAMAFAKEGAKVAVAARREERLTGVCSRIEAAGGKALAVQCDVCDRASIDAAVGKTVEAFGRIDVAYANAGFGLAGPFERLKTKDYRRQFETNFFGVIDTIYAVLPHLVASKGRLAMTGSVAGRMGAPTSSAYCSSKFAVSGLAESILFELAPQGVSVTLISPGFVTSEIRLKDNREVVHAERKDPVPAWLCMPAERAARDIVRAIYGRRFEAVITGHGKVLVFLARHFPRTLRAIGLWGAKRKGEMKGRTE